MKVFVCIESKSNVLKDNVAVVYSDYNSASDWLHAKVKYYHELMKNPESKIKDIEFSACESNYTEYTIKFFGNIPSVRLLVKKCLIQDKFDKTVTWNR